MGLCKFKKNCMLVDYKRQFFFSFDSFWCRYATELELQTISIKIAIINRDCNNIKSQFHKLIKDQPLAESERSFLHSPIYFQRVIKLTLTFLSRRVSYILKVSNLLTKKFIATVQWKKKWKKSSWFFRQIFTWTTDARYIGLFTTNKSSKLKL